METVDSENSQVILKTPPEAPNTVDRNKHPYLGRWDQKDGDLNRVQVKAW